MMSRERELLERAYQYIPMSSITSEEIRDYLMSPKPENIDTSEERVRESDISEAEPVAYWDTLNNILVPAVPLVSKRTCFKVEAVPLYLHPAPRKDFVRLSDEEITEIIGPYSMGTVGGYTRKLFDTIQDVLEEKNK